MKKSPLSTVGAAVVNEGKTRDSVVTSGKSGRPSVVNDGNGVVWKSGKTNPSVVAGKMPPKGSAVVAGNSKSGRPAGVVPNRLKSKPSVVGIWKPAVVCSGKTNGSPVV